MSPTRSLVVDTDTASDDAVALMLAVRHPGTAIRAVSVVAGNVPIEFGVRNALSTLDKLGADDVPVYRGCASPLLRPLETAQHVHGEDGMSGAAIYPPARGVEAEHAVDALLRISREEEGLHTLVTLGPLTNIAAALFVDPAFLSRFLHTYMMVGAADGRGNVSPAGEFNSWADPEAASVVFRAAGEKTMIGWDVSRKYALMGPADDEGLRGLGTLGTYASDINRAVYDFSTSISGVPGYDLPDPIAMAVVLDEGLVEEEHSAHVMISTAETTRGLTFADHRLPAKAANVRVVTRVNRQGFLAQLHRLLRDEVDE